LAVLAGALTVLGCGESGDGGNGNGGSAGSAGGGGSSGNGGSGGGIAITPGIWTAWAAGTAVCLYVNQDGTALVADAECDMRTPPSAFQFTTNRQPPDICGFSYPEVGEQPQPVPIVDNKFQIEDIQAGDVTIAFSGEFTGSNSVGGVASSTMNCPLDQAWSASPGCCSICDWCQ
jgi:hypothetical protein